MDFFGALVSITWREEEAQEAFVAQAACKPIGRAVKQADVLDNCDLSRIANVSEKDLSRIDRYKSALQQLT